MWSLHLKSASCRTTFKKIQKINAFFPEQVKIDEQGGDYIQRG